MGALYLERYLNFGLTGEELRGKPIIGIAQTGSDLSPCNRHHLELAKRVRDGIREAGGIAFEFPCHPIQETGKRPTACARPQPRLSRPGRDALRLSARRRRADHRLRQDHAGLPDGGATVNIPAIVLSAGPMLNGWHRGERTGSGTIVWKARQKLAAGEIDYQQFIDMVRLVGAVVGHCNTMGTASTMNSAGRGARHVAAGLRRDPRALPRARPDGLRDRQAHRRHGVGGPEALRHPDPRGVRERHRGNTAIGGSTNAPIHINAIARHIGVELDYDDWERIGYDIPLLVNMQPAGQVSRRGVLSRRRRAGGDGRADRAGKIHEDALTVNGRTIGENAGRRTWDREVIRPTTSR